MEKESTARTNERKELKEMEKESKDLRIMQDEPMEMDTPVAFMTIDNADELVSNLQEIINEAQQVIDHFKKMGNELDALNDYKLKYHWDHIFFEKRKIDADKKSASIEA